MSFEDYQNYLIEAKNEKISQNFTVFDICNSETAIEKKIDNTPDAQIIKNAEMVINAILEPCTKHFLFKPIVHCIYRNNVLNTAVGGVKDSQHCSGINSGKIESAADFTVVGVPDIIVVNYIRKNLVFDQLILESEGNNHWVHCSVKASGNRKEVLKYSMGKYVAI